MTGDMLDRVAQAIDPRAFGPLEGNYLFRSWQEQAQQKAYRSAEAVLRTLRDNTTHVVLRVGANSLDATNYRDPFDQFKEALRASMQEALRLGAHSEKVE